jgi:hypothetical protein
MNHEPHDTTAEAKAYKCAASKQFEVNSKMDSRKAAA